MGYAVIARYQCAPEDEAAVRDALLEMRDESRAEAANEAYEVHVVVGGFLLYERYADEAGFEAHKAAPHFKELIVETVWPLLTERTVTIAEAL
ncbi:putative quinol monooxygenase [Streptomyces sp. NPDC092369]|uniref:putative quinol monooxygenase n=1 Tax=Streptomyces sp. NPDC092369 TaxID=3366015 RepID=UPI0037FE7966